MNERKKLVEVSSSHIVNSTGEVIWFEVGDAEFDYYVEEPSDVAAAWSEPPAPAKGREYADPSSAGGILRGDGSGAAKAGERCETCGGSGGVSRFEPGDNADRCPDCDGFGSRKAGP